MISKIRDWFPRALANLKRIQHEPILAVGVAMEALHVYQQSTSGGLSPEDAAYAAVIAVLTLLGRQLVFPATKVQVTAGGIAVSAVEPEEEPLGKPYTGEEE
jgi:hypothetical protein